MANHHVDMNSFQRGQSIKGTTENVTHLKQKHATQIVKELGHTVECHFHHFGDYLLSFCT